MSILSKPMMVPVILGVLSILLAPDLALAQMMGGRCENCPMGTGMWLSMLLVVLLVVAAIVALAALAVFLFRRSRPPHGPREA